MTRRPGLRRAVGGLLLGALTVTATSLLGLDPEPLRVLLLALLALGGLRLLLDGLPRVAVLWYPTTRAHAAIGAGRDPVMQSHLRALEDHQLTRRPDSVVRDRLAALADRVLLGRHGVTARSEHGRELLGPELDQLLHGPVVRLNPRRIDRMLRQIEEL